MLSLFGFFTVYFFFYRRNFTVCAMCLVSGINLDFVWQKSVYFPSSLDLIFMTYGSWKTCFISGPEIFLTKSMLIQCYFGFLVLKVGLYCKTISFYHFPNKSNLWTSCVFGFCLGLTVIFGCWVYLEAAGSLVSLIVEYNIKLDEANVADVIR